MMIFTLILVVLAILIGLGGIVSVIYLTIIKPTKTKNRWKRYHKEMDNWYKREYDYIEDNLNKMKERGILEEEIKKYKEEEYNEMAKLKQSEERTLSYL